MDRGKEQALQAERVVDQLDDGCGAVGRHRGVGDDTVRGGELIVVDPHHHRDVRLVGRWHAQDHPLGARIQVLLHLGTAAGVRGRLHRHVDAQCLPVDVAGLTA